MATKLRRITISLPADVDVALKRFSDATGTNQSGFVVECLRQNVATLHALADAVDAAKSGDMAGYERLVKQSLGEALYPLVDSKPDKRD
jgi:hypothetical protein